MIKLTESQKQAINTINENLAVNAGAGSGKTKVLVDRYINILENGNLDKYSEIESIVAITFTKKAQGEMKERIRKRVIEKIEEESKEKEYWKRIYEDLEMANISTIHAFCSKILSENPIESSVQPKFKILEEYEKKKFIEEILSDIFTIQVEKDNQIYNFLEYFTPFSIEESMHKDNIIQTLKRIYLDIRTTGKNINYIEDLTLKNIENLEVDFSNLDAIKEKVLYLIENSRKNSKLAKLKNDEIWLELYDKQSNQIKKEDLFNLAYIKENLGKNKKLQDNIDEVKSMINNLLVMLEKLNKDIYIFTFYILKLLDKKYSEKKQKLSKLDYEDLQILTLQLFDNKNILNHYINKFKYIMIDEFQDTDNLQKSILYKLCSLNKPLDRNNLFVVGDPKQSIYRFRGADVSVFDEVSKDISNKNNDLIINLDDNFRTVNTIMKVINDFFIKLMVDKYQILNSNKSTENEIDVEILKNDEIEIPNDENKSEYHKKIEADLIAKRIKLSVDKGEYNYSDFAVLFRSMTDVSLYESALKKYNIPFSNFSGEGLLYLEQIVDIMNALKSINNNDDMISFIGFLRSSMIGVSDSTLYKHFYDYEDFIENKEKDKLEFAYSIIKRFNKLKKILRVDELLIELLKVTKFKETCLLLDDNVQKISNIEKFIDFVKRIVYEENLDLNEFINYIDDFKKYGQDIEKDNVNSLDSKGVSIMTIHKSKGLQFKVIIIPQTSKPFRNNNLDILFSKYKGLGIKHVDKNQKKSKELSFIYSNILENESIEDFEENKRILYVAMTRAEERLILGSQSLGRNYKNSFKSMIEENISTENIKYINNIDLEYEKIPRVKNFQESHLKKRDIDTNIFPLINIKNNIKKKFETLSISAYMKFKNCQRSFYYEYYKKSPVINFNNSKGNMNNTLSSIEKGVLVHRICEVYNPEIDKYNLIKKVFQEKNINITTDKINEILPYINNYIDMNDFHNKKQYNEIHFYYNILDIKLSGVIDKIIIDGNKATIIDFKTNDVKNKKHILDQYSTQMQLYTSVVKDLYKINVEKARIMLLKTGEYMDIDISEDGLNKNMDRIKKFITFVNTHNEELHYTKNTNKCIYCQYQKICK